MRLAVDTCQLDERFFGLTAMVYLCRLVDNFIEVTLKTVGQESDTIY